MLGNVLYRLHLQEEQNYHRTNFVHREVWWFLWRDPKRYQVCNRLSGKCTGTIEHFSHFQTVWAPNDRNEQEIPVYWNIFQQKHSYSSTRWGDSTKQQKSTIEQTRNYTTSWVLQPLFKRPELFNLHPTGNNDGALEPRCKTEGDMKL